MSGVIVHNLEQSRSFRVLWLLEELGQKHEVKQYKRDPKASNGPAQLAKVHPLGKSPVVEVDGKVVAETGAIFEYALERFDKAHELSFKPGTEAQQQLKYWLHYSEGTLMSIFEVALNLRAAGADFSGALDQLKLNAGFLESELGKHKWFVGDSFSAADINLEFPVEVVSNFPGMNPSEYPKLTAWRESIKARPAYKKALESNGHYDVKGLF